MCNIALSRFFLYQKKNCCRADPAEGGSRMKKRLIVLLCAVALLLGAVSVSHGASTIYFTALNDRLLALSDDTMPVRSGGAIYVPASTFNTYTTGVALGTYCVNTGDLLFIYDTKKQLTFDLKNGTCYDENNVYYSAASLSRGGKIYVPAGFVASFFGLTFSYLSTDYGYLVRICSSAAVLSDSQFVASAPTAMQYRLSTYLAALAPDDTPAPEDPADPEPEDPGQGETDAGDGPAVALAFRVTADTITPALDLLEDRGQQALILVPASDAAACADGLRRAAAAGHTLGLTVDAALSPQEQAAALEAANAVVAAAALTQCRIADLPGSTRAQRKSLEALGWLTWNEGAVYAGASPSGFYSAIADRAAVNVTLAEESAALAQTGRLLRRMDSNRCTLVCPTETGM